MDRPENIKELEFNYVALRLIAKSNTCTVEMRERIMECLFYDIRKDCEKALYQEYIQLGFKIIKQCKEDNVDYFLHADPEPIYEAGENNILIENFVFFFAEIYVELSQDQRDKLLSLIHI